MPGGRRAHEGGSGDYTIRSNPVPGELSWRWCHKCQGIFYGNNPGSKCPAGGAHSKQGSGNYSLLI